MIANETKEYNDAIQDRIVAAIDKHGDNEPMGGDMLSLIALQARRQLSTGKPNRFLSEFAESLNIKVVNFYTFAQRILSELYPSNPAYWEHYDKININRVKNSVWLKNQHLCQL